MKANHYIFAFLCSVLFSILSLTGYSQITLTADSTTCGATSTTLHANLLGDVPTASGITADDGYSSVINIGFTYNFYGSADSQLLIGSNGCLCFDLSLAGGYNPWPISAALAGNASAYNSICGPWCDIYIPAGGTITYSTIGTAPYRKFMATFCHTRMYSCTTQWITTQIIIYETTDVAEVHIGHKTICSGWNGGYAICGVQNASGSASTVAPSRDYPTTWTATDEAWRFTPNTSRSAYTVSSITYAPVPYSSSTICWYDSTTGAFLGTGSSISVSPTGGVGTYYATAAGCDDSTFAYIHVDLGPHVSFLGRHLDTEIHTQPTVCGACDGTIKLIGSLIPGVSDTVYFYKDSIAQPYVVLTAAADSSVTLTGLCAGRYEGLTIRNGNPCPSNELGPVYLVDPPIHASFDMVRHLGCTNDQIVLTNNSTPPGYTSAWTYGDGSPTDNTTSPSHTFTVQGVYTVTLVYSTYGSCFDTVNQVVDVRHPLVAAFTPSSNGVCLGTPIAFTNNSIAGAPHYIWTFGDGTTSNAANPVHTYLNGGWYRVTLSVTDSIPCKASADTSVQVVEIHAKVGFIDTTVCLKIPMPLLNTVTVEPDSNVNLLYQWTPGTNLSNPNAAVPYFSGVGDYVYTLTATSLPLGCMATDVTTVHSEPPIIFTNVTPDQAITVGGSVQLNADGAWIYEWTPNDGSLNNPNINNPIAKPIDSITTYRVIGSSVYGCKDTAYVTVHVDEHVNDMMPSAFTPNGDGKNDVFRLVNFTYQKLVAFRVFNRWGKELFSTIDPKKGWDGTFEGAPQDIGVYYYEIVVAYPDGGQKSISGSVTLIR